MTRTMKQKRSLQHNLPKSITQCFLDESFVLKLGIYVCFFPSFYEMTITTSFERRTGARLVGICNFLGFVALFRFSNHRETFWQKPGSNRRLIESPGWEESWIRRLWFLWFAIRIANHSVFKTQNKTVPIFARKLRKFFAKIFFFFFSKFGLSIKSWKLVPPTPPLPPTKWEFWILAN